MATWDDVSRMCRALPETTEETSREGHRQWKVRDKSFVWERPLRRKDVAELGDAAPAGPVVAAHVPDEGAKAALIAAEPGVYFTTSHFNGYAIILVELEKIDVAELRELLVEAWLARAPKRLAKQFLDAVL